jgi:hypothetical protein
VPVVVRHHSFNAGGGAWYAAAVVMSPKPLGAGETPEITVKT